MVCGNRRLLQTNKKTKRFPKTKNKRSKIALGTPDNVLGFPVGAGTRIYRLSLGNFVVIAKLLSKKISAPINLGDFPIDGMWAAEGVEPSSKYLEYLVLPLNYAPMRYG